MILTKTKVHHSIVQGYTHAQLILASTVVKYMYSVMIHDPAWLFIFTKILTENKKQQLDFFDLVKCIRQGYPPPPLYWNRTPSTLKKIHSDWVKCNKVAEMLVQNSICGRLAYLTLPACNFMVSSQILNLWSSHLASSFTDMRTWVIRIRVTLAYFPRSNF